MKPFAMVMMYKSLTHKELKRYEMGKFMMLAKQARLIYEEIGWTSDDIKDLFIGIITKLQEQKINPDFGYVFGIMKEIRKTAKPRMVEEKKSVISYDWLEDEIERYNKLRYNNIYNI